MLVCGQPRQRNVGREQQQQQALPGVIGPDVWERCACPLQHRRLIGEPPKERISWRDLDRGWAAI